MRVALIQNPSLDAKGGSLMQKEKLWPWDRSSCVVPSNILERSAKLPLDEEGSVADAKRGAEPFRYELANSHQSYGILALMHKHLLDAEAPLAVLDCSCTDGAQFTARVRFESHEGNSSSLILKKDGQVVGECWHVAGWWISNEGCPVG